MEAVGAVKYEHRLQSERAAHASELDKRFSTVLLKVLLLMGCSDPRPSNA